MKGVDDLEIMKKEQSSKLINEFVQSIDPESTEVVYCEKTINRENKIQGGWILKKHSHELMELIYFVEGRAEIDVNDKVISPRISNLVVYPPGLVHQEYPDFLHPLEIIIVSLRVDVPTNLNLPLQLIDNSGEFLWLMEHIYMERMSKEDGVTKLSGYYAKALIALIQKYYLNHVPKSNDIFDYCLHYIHERYFEEIDIPRLSALVNASPSYVSRLFRKYTGLPPIHYINYIRIEAAKKLLCSSDLSVNRIAHSVGIEDPLYFSRLFKKSTGLSPIVYKLKQNE
jgi:AraC family transcriptional regulator of arabinose operon